MVSEVALTAVPTMPAAEPFITQAKELQARRSKQEAEIEGLMQKSLSRKS